jgi:hypothetical protein
MPLADGTLSLEIIVVGFGVIISEEEIRSIRLLISVFSIAAIVTSDFSLQCHAVYS